MFELLNDDQKKWVNLAEKLAVKFGERARESDEKAEFTFENFEDLREHGFLKLPITEKYGGYGVDAGNHHLTAYLVTEVISAKCPTTAWNLIIHFHQCGVVARMGNEEICKRIFGDIIENGKIMGSLGSEVNPLQAIASKDTETKLTFKAGLTPVEGGFIANGTKGFCSSGPVADYLLYWALAPGTETNGEGLTICVVERDTPGVTFSSKGWNEIIGLRGTLSYNAEIKDVFIPWENIVGQPGDFVQEDPYTYELSQSAHLLGIAQGALDFVLRVLRERPFLAKEDGLMGIVGEMGARVKAARSFLWQGAELFKHKHYSEAALTSYQVLSFTKVTTMWVLDKAFETVGTRALFKFNPLERLWREARVSSLHTRQTQINQLVAEGMVSEDFFPKHKYGVKVDERKQWSELKLEYEKQLS